MICNNGEYFEYEQDDKPDYLGYHLSENFEEWFLNQNQRLSFKEVKDLSISTDGIFTFKHFDNKNYDTINENDLIDFMLIDRQWDDQENMLKKKLLEVEHQYGLKPSDDLSIIRMILD